jgi:hypothetical protein
MMRKSNDKTNVNSNVVSVSDSLKKSIGQKRNVNASRAANVHGSHVLIWSDGT